LSICCRILVTLRSRQVKPHKCADKVFRHTPALGIHESEITLCEGVALVSRKRSSDPTAQTA
jgi:hypothetical protein